MGIWEPWRCSIPLKRTVTPASWGILAPQRCSNRNGTRIRDILGNCAPPQPLRFLRWRGLPPSPGEPSAFAGEPSVFAGETSVFAGEPSVFAGEPSAFAGEPSAFAGEPSAFAGEPSAFAGEPSVFAGEPSAAAAETHPYPAAWPLRRSSGCGSPSLRGILLPPSP